MTDLARLLALFGPYWRWMTLAVVLSLAAVFANVGLMAVSGWFIAAMGLAGAVGASMNYFTPAAAIRALAIVRTGGRYAERVVSHEATLRLLAGLRVWLYERLEPLAPAGLQLFRSGDLLTRMRSDVDRLETLFLRLLAPAAVALLASIAVVAFLARYHALVAIAQAALLAAVGLLLPLLVARAGAGASTQITHGAAQLNSQLIDTIEGLAELHAYGQSAGHAGRAARLFGEVTANEQRLARMAALSQAGVGLAASLALWFVLVLVMPAVADRRIAPAELAMLAFLALASFEAVAPLPLAIQSLAGTLASARRLLAIADAVPPVCEPQRPARAPASGDLVLRDVWLAYPGSRRAALAGVDLTLSPGRKTAVLGASGSGKSSLVDLAMRFRVPTRGSMTFGGVPLDELRSEDLRARLSAVSQRDHLFASTIADNLRVASPHATGEQIAAACRIAQMHDFVVAQPAGYDTFVGAHGLSLSGGQARRLAVARALLKDAPVLMLDEPTEGVDAETEQALIRAVVEARPHCAMMLITHRPVGLELMDEIIVLEEGRIVERGTPGVLMAHSARLRRLFDLVAVQAAGVEAS